MFIAQLFTLFDIGAAALDHHFTEQGVFLQVSFLLQRLIVRRDQLFRLPRREPHLFLNGFLFLDKVPPDAVDAKMGKPSVITANEEFDEMLKIEQAVVDRGGSKQEDQLVLCEFKELLSTLSMTDS